MCNQNKQGVSCHLEMILLGDDKNVWVKRSVEQHLLDTTTISFETLVVMEQLRDVSETQKKVTETRKVKCKTKKQNRRKQLLKPP